MNKYLLAVGIVILIAIGSVLTNAMYIGAFFLVKAGMAIFIAAALYFFIRWRIKKVAPRTTSRFTR